jgi:hypothetical protein
MNAPSYSILIKVVAVLLLATLCAPFFAGGSQGATPLGDSERQQLAEQYAPVLQYVKGESCYPVDVDYYLQSCSLYQVVDDSAFLITDDPTIPELAQLTTDDYFLNNRLGGVDDDKIVQAYQQNLSQLGYTVYFHVDSEGQTTYVQYWMFYVFNPGSVNSHQGDWEMVQVVLDGDMQPVGTTFSQHHSGVSAGWSDVLVQDGAHPIVYVALGSHANYYRYYQGKIQGMDVCGQDGLNLDPSEYELLEIREEIPGGTPDTSWVWYGGRWGTIPDVLADARGDAGPPGPMYREEGGMWDGSVFAADAKELSTDTLWLEFLIYYLSWIIIGFFLLAVALTIRRVYKKKKKGELKFPYFELLNIRAKGRRGAANILALIGLVVAVIGLIYPVFTMEIWVLEGQYATGGFVTLFSLGGTDLFVLNTLDPSGEVINVGAFAVNFALILGTMVALFILNNLAAGSKRASRKYIGFAITLLIIFTVFFLVVISIGPVASTLAPSDDQGLVDILEYMSQNPFGGSATLDNPTFGEVQLRWGFELGSLLLPAGIILIIAGLVMRSAAKAEGQ